MAMLEGSPFPSYQVSTVPYWKVSLVGAVSSKVVNS
jgi:hypothetical protein